MNRVLETGTVTLGNKREGIQAAYLALDHYGLAGSRLSLLDSGEDFTYRVDVPNEPAFLRHAYLGRVAGKRFVLRVQHTEERAQATRSELIWLAALLRDTDLAVPEPVPTRYGSLLAPFAASDEGGYCVLLRWVEGDAESCATSGATLQKLGRYIATLHNHAESYTVPDGFVRPRRSHEWLVDMRSALATAASYGCVTGSNMRLFEQVANRVGRTMQHLGESRSVFGLIQGGLQSTNYLCASGQISCVNFSNCAWAYYLFDIASALYELESSSDYLPMREALLRGYRQIRALSDEHESLLETFILAHHLERLSRILSSHDPYIAPWVPRFVEKWSERMLKREM